VVGLWSRLADLVGRWWGRLEDGLRRAWRLIRRRQARLEAEARLLAAEAAQLGVRIWDAVDDLPFVPSLQRISPVHNQFYGHGAFMGAAPALLADRQWRRILAFLMPDVYEQVSRAAQAGTRDSGIIPMFENNPVMAAFGVVRSVRQRRAEDEPPGPHDLSGLEWDVFLDGDELARWHEAPDAARPAHVARLVDTMVIAHASSTDTMQERLGFCQYEDVRSTPKTHLGGVEASAWLDLFGRALRLSQATDLDAALREMAREPRVETLEECRRFTFATPWPAPEVVGIYREITGKSQLGVILEIKSLRSTPEFLGSMVQELNRRGLHVVAVASFLLAEVAGVGRVRQEVAGELLDGPREILFLHFAGDLQEAADRGELPTGASILFNGASLLDALEHDDGRPPTYSAKLGVVRELADYQRRYQLHLGIYVQEGDCDSTAASLLADLVQARAETFELGFAWGGLRDLAAFEPDGRPHLGYGSQRQLQRVGIARQWVESRREADLEQEERHG